MNKFITCLIICFTFSTLRAQTIIGKWKTIDDLSGKPRSIVEIYEKNGKYFGKITQLFLAPGEDQNPVCEKCSESDARFKKPIIDLEIIRDMKLEKDGKTYASGSILDPETGGVYDCKLWLENGQLMVRGYLYFFYRTQTWLPFIE